jgi:enoyl-CoA hydratase/carnithine racemase
MDLGTPHLRWERLGGTVWLTLDRPDRRNAMTANMYFGIRRAIDRLNQSSNLHALVITGTGDVFAPGGDLGGQHDDGDVDYGALLGTAALPFDAIRESRKPIVAMVNGLCMGGGLLIAMLADVAVASDRAVFAAPELRRGVADAYHAAILPEQVGIAVARDMLFTGRRLNATEALSHGLIARIATHDELRVETDRVLHDLLLSAPRARTALKRLINARYGSVDKITFDESLAGDEAIEGFTAFVEKRAPSWAPDDTGASDRV